MTGTFRNRWKALARAALPLLASQAAEALNYTAISVPIRSVICGIYWLLFWLAGAIAALVLIAAVVQYIYNRDNPGKRKQAMDIMIQAFVGLILVGITKSVIDSIGYVKACEPKF